jgi:amidophosphoribosyltransferase
MSDALKHECGIALIRLLKPLEFYKENTELLSTEYKNVSSHGKAAQPRARWCRFCKYKLDVEAGNVTLVVRSNHAQPIQDVFAQINDRINEEMAAHPEYADDVALQKQKSIFRRIVLFVMGLLVKQYRKRTSF